MWAVITCIGEDHDLKLVGLAAIVCIASAVTALRFHKRVQSQIGRAQWGWALITGFVAGGGVWSTHFIAMLAYSPGLPIAFDLGVTAASLALIVAGMTVGLLLAARTRTAAGLVAAGAIVGLSIVVMHFTGVSAMRMLFGIEWHWGYVAASVFWSMAGAVATVFALRRFSGVASWFAPPALFILTVVGLHFTATTAMIVIPDLTAPPMEQLESRIGLAILVGGVSLAILICAAILAGLDTHNRKLGMRSLEIAFQGVPSGLALFGQDGRLVIWNEAYQRLTAQVGMSPFVGATRYDLLRQSAIHSRAPRTEAEFDAWAQSKSLERAAGLVQEWPTLSGGWIRTELSRLADGSTITVINDITSLKAATDALTEARDKAEAASRAKSEFLANMSHEIRTPLNGVLGMAQVIEADDLSPVQRDRIKVVRDSGMALMAILNDLLDLSKVQAGKLELAIDEVDMASLAHKVAAAFEGAAAARDLDLVVEIDEAARGLWMGDALRLRQVLSNLVGNALKFTHQGRVTLAVEPAEGGVAFRVRDTGIGISADHLPGLFDAFSQADATTTRRYGGTGLGLSISHDIVALMGGQITVTSEPGQGSCFTVTLPTTWVAPSFEDGDVAAAPEARRAVSLRILAAEDNLTNQLVLRSLLQPTGCDLVVVGNGRLAADAAATGRFDVILMDIQMPEMNGVEATLAIRAAERAKGRKPTPIIALSANVMPHQLAEYAQAGMNHWVAKPIEVDKLYAGLDLVLDAAEADSPGETAAA